MHGNAKPVALTRTDHTLAFALKVMRMLPVSRSHRRIVSSQEPVIWDHVVKIVFDQVGRNELITRSDVECSTV
jgi:hypothetical protein